MSRHVFRNPRVLSEAILRKAALLARHRWALAIIFVLEVAGCAIVPLPIALVMVGMVSAAPEKWARFAVAASLGSVVGAVALYIIGGAFFNSVGQDMVALYANEESWLSIVDWFNGEWGTSLVFIAGATTGLFRVASLGAGFAGMNPLLFIIAVVLSRFSRWLIECYAIRYLGGRIRSLPFRYLRRITFS